MLPLMLLGDGEAGVIVEIRGNSGREGEMFRTEEMGLRVGNTVRLLNRGGNCGPVLLKVDESRIAVARTAAMKILVRREEQ